MRIIVTGGRHYNGISRIRDVLHQHDTTPPPTLVHGACRTGADAHAARIAKHELGWHIEPHPAEWPIYGKRAGPIRNAAMAALGADLCIAFPGGDGTANMMTEARSHGIPVIIID